MVGRLRSTLCLIVVGGAVASSASAACAEILFEDEARRFRAECRELSGSDLNGVLFGVINLYSTDKDDIGIRERTPVSLQFESLALAEAEESTPFCVDGIVSAPHPKHDNKRYFVAPIDARRAWRLRAFGWLPTEEDGSAFPRYQDGSEPRPIYRTSYSYYATRDLMENAVYYGTLVIGVDSELNESVIHWRYTRRAKIEPNYATGKYNSELDRLAGKPEISSMYELAAAAKAGKAEGDLVSYGRAVLQQLFGGSLDQSRAEELLDDAIGAVAETQAERAVMVAAWPYFEQGKQLEAENKPEEAIKSYKRAIDAYAGYYEAYESLIELLQRQAKAEEAIPYLERWVTAARPWRPEPYEKLVETLISDRQIERAERLLRETPIASVLYAASSAAGALKDHAWAIELRSEALERNRSDRSIYASEDKLRESVASLEVAAAIHQHWMDYLKGIQERGQDANWSVKPFDSFAAQFKPLRE